MSSESIKSMPFNPIKLYSLTQKLIMFFKFLTIFLSSLMLEVAPEKQKSDNEVFLLKIWFIPIIENSLSFHLLQA